VSARDANREIRVRSRSDECCQLESRDARWASSSFAWRGLFPEARSKAAMRRWRGPERGVLRAGACSTGTAGCRDRVGRARFRSQWGGQASTLRDSCAAHGALPLIMVRCADKEAANSPMRSHGSRRSCRRGAATAARRTAGPVSVTVSRLSGLLTQLTARPVIPAPPGSGAAYLFTTRRYTQALRGEMSSRFGQCLVRLCFPAVCLSVK